MGTSASFRAPSVPRWQAFTVALQEGLPLERLQSELFNAGVEWQDALAAPGVAVVAATLIDAQDELADRLRRSDRPESVVVELMAEARAASDLEQGTPAMAMAERALAAVVTRIAAGDRPLSEASPTAAGDHWAAARGDPGRLVASYLGELLGQYARHVTAREAGRLTEGEGGLPVRATRHLTRELAAAAEAVGRGTEVGAGDAATVRDGWARLIADAFTRGRRLPRGGQ